MSSLQQSNSNTSSNGSLISASAQGIKFLIMLQVSSRVLTFAVNQLLLRYLSPALLGLSAQLELLNISILYFSRESLRNALLRQTSSNSSSQVKQTVRPKDNDSQVIVNLSWLTPPLGVIFSIILGASYSRSAKAASEPYFNLSLFLYILATILELVVEPSFAVAQQNLLYKVRAIAESSATFVRCIVTCGITIYATQKSWQIGPLQFAIGQTSYSIVLLLVYLWKISIITKKDGFTRWPQKLEAQMKTENAYYFSLFNKQLSSLALTMWIQSTTKHVLTQGDSLLVAYLTTIHDQGIYAIASNYGSLIARMFFQPLEESARNLFSKLLSPSTSINDGIKSGATILKMILKVYLILSCLILSLGSPFASLALHLVAGSRWSEAGVTLATYCYYIPLLAINGITEAFVQSVANPAQLHNQSVWMFGFSVGFATAGYFFVNTLGLGAEGIVWANAVNMAMRIIWSSIFITRYFKSRDINIGIGEVIPNSGFIAVCVGVGATARYVVQTESGIITQLGYAAILGIFSLAFCGLTERRFFAQLKVATISKSQL